MFMVGRKREGRTKKGFCLRGGMEQWEWENRHLFDGMR